MELKDLISLEQKGESFTVPPELMQEYIGYLYTKHPFIHDFLHMKIEDVAQGDITLSMELCPIYLNSRGTLYGGVLAAIADSVSLGLIAGIGKYAVTTHLSMNYVRASGVSGKIFIHGSLRHHGRKMIAIRGEILNEEGKLLSDLEMGMEVTAEREEIPKYW